MEFFSAKPSETEILPRQLPRLPQCRSYTLSQYSNSETALSCVVLYIYMVIVAWQDNCCGKFYTFFLYYTGFLNILKIISIFRQSSYSLIVQLTIVFIWVLCMTLVFVPARLLRILFVDTRLRHFLQMILNCDQSIPQLVYQYHAYSRISLRSCQSYIVLISSKYATCR